MASSAKFLFAWGSDDVDLAVQSIMPVIRFQRALFSPLAYSVKPSKFSPESRTSENFRKFESTDLWVFRGREHLQEDTGKFLADLSSGKCGYLQAATGMGKSTGIVRDVAARSGKKVILVSPEERLVGLTWQFVTKREEKRSDALSITRFTGSGSSSSMDGDLVYMTATTLLLSVMSSTKFLDKYEVALIYVDEAHFQSAEYDVLRCLAMLGIFGSRTLAFSTATPPGRQVQEAFREIEPAIENFPTVMVTSPIEDVHEGMPFHYSTLAGPVLIFAADDNHASNLHAYYLSHDIDCLLLTSASRSTDWAAMIKKFSVPGASTKILVTTFVLETGYTFCFHTVVDFSLRPVIVYDEKLGLFLQKVRPISSELAAQRAGRAGRLGGQCRVFRMTPPFIPESAAPVSTLVKDLQWFCWLQLYNIRSNQLVFHQMSEVMGRLTHQKIRMVLSSSMHPVLLLKYLDEDGFAKLPFLEGLRSYFPAHFDFDKLVKVDYREATKEFIKYSNEKFERDAKIPLPPGNYFMADMLYVDMVARHQKRVDDDLISFAGDAVVSESRKKETKETSLAPVKMLADAVRENSLHRRDETVAALEGFGELKVKEKESAIAAIRHFTNFSPVVPEVDVDWSSYDKLKYSQAQLQPPESPTKFDRQVQSIAPSMGVSPSRLRDQEYERAALVAKNRRSQRPPVPPKTQSYREAPVTVRERPILPREISEPESVYPTVKYDQPSAISGYAASFRGTDFHPTYGPEPVMTRPMIPTLAPVPRPVTFREIAQPVEAEQHTDSMLFPYADVTASRERYVRPTYDDICAVADWVNGRERISDLSHRARERAFTSLLKVWNANVVDDAQYSSKMQHVRSESETGESRLRSGKTKKAVRIYKGKRFTEDELLTQFSAFRQYGLIPCIPMQQVVSHPVPHSSTRVGDRSVCWYLKHLDMQKGLNFKVDLVTVKRSLREVGLLDSLQAIELFVSGVAWEYVWTQVLPNSHLMVRLGFVLGAALSYDQKTWTVGHCVGKARIRNDLIVIGDSSKSSIKPVPVPMAPGDMWFVLVTNPTVQVGLEMSCAGVTVRIVGPLVIEERSSEGFMICKGTSVRGMSGAAVVSATTGHVVGLLFGVDAKTSRVLVSLI